MGDSVEDMRRENARRVRALPDWKKAAHADINQRLAEECAERYITATRSALEKALREAWWHGWTAIRTDIKEAGRDAHIKQALDRLEGK